MGVKCRQLFRSNCIFKISYLPLSQETEQWLNNDILYWQFLNVLISFR